MHGAKRDRAEMSSDEEMARQLQEQFDAEAALGGAQRAPPKRAAPGQGDESKASTLSTGSGKWEVKLGDISDATEQYIAHQCNCITPGARGVAQALFQRFPEANVYKHRIRANPATHNTPGTIIVKSRIINMFAQVAPGKPSARESAEQRLRWFSECLDRIAGIKGIRSLAFPCRVGCGLAGGHWPTYEQLLKDFGQKHGLDITLYDFGPPAGGARGRGRGGGGGRGRGWGRGGRGASLPKT